MRIVVIDRCIVFVTMCMLFLAANRYAGAVAEASCTKAECFESKLEVHDLNAFLTRNQYDQAQGFNAKNPNPLKGTVTLYLAAKVNQATLCVGNDACAPRPFGVSEGLNYTKCMGSVPSNHWFCADMNGKGVTGSWNVGKDNMGN